MYADNVTASMPMDSEPGLREEVKRYALALNRTGSAMRDFLSFWEDYAMDNVTDLAHALADEAGWQATALDAFLVTQQEAKVCVCVRARAWRAGGPVGSRERTGARVRACATQGNGRGCREVTVGQTGTVCARARGGGCLGPDPMVNPHPLQGGL